MEFSEIYGSPDLQQRLLMTQNRLIDLHRFLMVLRDISDSMAGTSVEDLAALQDQRNN